MINKNFLLKDNIKLKNFKTGLTNKLSKKFHKIFIDINNDIKNDRKTLNVLDNKFQLSLKIRELNKFKKFQTIAIIGMGGSILGAEAIYNFLKTKIKKKVYFLMIWMKIKSEILKDKRKIQKYFLSLFQNQVIQLKLYRTLFYLKRLKEMRKM